MAEGEDDDVEHLANTFADLYWGGKIGMTSATEKVKMAHKIIQAVEDGRLSIEELKQDIRDLDDKGVAEDYTPDTNYSYTVVGNGKESQAYDSKEAARDAVRKLGAGYKIKRKPRTSARSVKKHFSNRNIDEESSTSSEAVEIALIRRVLVAHTDLIMNFGLDKVTQAIEEVAYNVGDVDEIGTSDVSGWIHQVKQILGVEA